MENTNKKLEEILSLPWSNEYILHPIPEDEGGGYCAYIPLFGKKGCRADGDTANEAIRNLENLLRTRIQNYLDNGWDTPTPKNTKVSKTSITEE